MFSYFGRPKGKPKSSMSLQPIVKPLSDALSGIDVRFAPDCVSALAHALVDAPPDGSVALTLMPIAEERGGSLAEIEIGGRYSLLHRLQLPAG